MGRVLVTGGAGYIGSHAAKTLTQIGREVIVYDNLSAGHREAALGAPLIEADIRDVESVRRALRHHSVTSVMHFAALGSVGDSVRDPAPYYRHNVEGTLSILEAMARESVSLLVFSSTAAVFGEPTSVPITETHPTCPINAYGETKLAIERALGHFARAYGIQFVTLRYFNAAGADPDGQLGEDHDPEQHLIPLAIDAARGGAPLRVFGDDYPTPDGTCLRDYIHVSDLADAHVRALDHLERGGASATYNLGNGRPHSVREVVEAVGRVAGCPVRRVRSPRRDGDPAVLYASSEKIKAELGWTPRFEDLHVIVETAWRWRVNHPGGFSSH